MEMELPQAIVFAADAHRGQVDKGGRPYFLHVMRVAADLSLTTDHECMAGLLHDVVEDTPVSLEDLRTAGVPAPVVEAVDALSRREGEVYMDYIVRCGADPIARKVKIADIKDNLSPARMQGLPESEQRSMTKRYQRALGILENWES